MKQHKTTKLFFQDERWSTQCPFCRTINQGRGASLISACTHLEDANWTFKKAIFECQDTGIHCPVCLEKFKQTEGIKLPDEQVLCAKCGIKTEINI